MKKLILIDSHALLHRFFHALPPLTSPSGKPTQALYGLSSVLLKLIREQQPDYIAGTFDRPEPTFRKKAFSDYKAHRAPTANPLIEQLIESRNVFGKFDIPIFEKAGFEADDIIGTLAKHFSSEPDLKIIILSGDLDLLQLVKNDSIIVDIIRSGFNNNDLYNEARVYERYELSPSQLPDYKGIVGDTSDNIPGVKGIGKKTATELLKEFKSVEGVYENLGLIKNVTADKLEADKDRAFLSRDLATIHCTVPIDMPSLNDVKSPVLNIEELSNYFTEMGFSSLTSRL